MARPDSFQRWQKITIDQHGAVINLLLTISVAAQGFIYTQIKDPGGARHGWLWASEAAFMLSSALGLCCSVNRLCDFRLTAKIARVRSKLSKHYYRDTCSSLNGDDLAMVRAKLKKARIESKRLGRKTWLVFGFQLFLFVLGSIFMATAAWPFSS
jgi:hypothetical protein